MTDNIKELLNVGNALVGVMNEGADTNPVTRRQVFFDFQSALHYAEMEPEAKVRAESIDTLRRLLKIVQPNVCGYEMRALPGLVIEGAERMARERGFDRKLIDSYAKRCDTLDDLEEENHKLRKSLRWAMRHVPEPETKHNIYVNNYSDAVAIAKEDGNG